MIIVQNPTIFHIMGRPLLSVGYLEGIGYKVI